MKLINGKMRSGICIMLLTACFFSCKEKLYYGDVDCSECYQIKPDSADLVVHLTVNDIYPEVPLVFYRGNIEDQQIEYVDTAYSDTYYLWVAVNRDYSVRAEYARGPSTIYAVDGTKIQVYTVPDACDETCYIIEDETLDARLNSRYQ